MPRFHLLILVGLLSFPVFTNAADICKTTRSNLDATPTERLGRLFTKGCLGKDKDADATAKQVLEIVNAGNTDINTAVEMLNLLKIQLRVKALNVKLPDGIEPNPYSLLADRIEKTAANFASTLPDNTSTKILQRHYRLEKPDGLALGVDDTGKTYYEVETRLIEPACTVQTDETCKEAFTIGEDLIRFTELTRSTIASYKRNKIDEYTANLVMIDDAWTQYATEARSQFVWELWANGHLFENGINAKRDEKTDPLLESPPDWQLILAHPGVAVEYVDDANSGSKFEPALLVEWVGINWLRWNQKDTKNGRRYFMNNPVGVSFITTFSDRNGADNVGYGLMGHFRNRYSLGVTSHDGDIGVSLSLNLLSFFQSKSAKIEGVNQGIRNIVK